MNKFNSDNYEYEIEVVLGYYLTMINDKEHCQYAYSSLQEISSTFPHVDEENFHDKLNSALIEEFNLDLIAIEQLFSKESMKFWAERLNVFEIIRQIGSVR